jgi:hypothetical protein
VAEEAWNAFGEPMVRVDVDFERELIHLKP